MDGGAILYQYRAGTLDQPDNRALEAAHELQSPLIYFKGMAPGQYVVIAPVFVRVNDSAERVVLLDTGLQGIDTQPGGPISTPEMRKYALREVRVRLHQQRFRQDVLRAYRQRCTVCALREGLQGFHGAKIRKPRLVAEHPDPERLALRFSEFEAAA
jgi:putative restriction endonuclease